MKTNKRFNLEEKIHKCKLGIMKNFKFVALVPLLIALAGGILFATVGFNKSIDFTGGTAARVYIGETYTFEQAQSKVDSVLEDNGLEASVYLQTQDNGENYITVKYQNKEDLTDLQTTNLNLEVVDDLFAEFAYDSEDMQQVNYVQGNQKLSSDVAIANLTNMFLAIVISTVAIAVYLGFRNSHQVAITNILAVFHDLIIALSLALIFRIEINTTLLAGIMFVYVYSLMSNSLYFSKVKENSKEFKKGKDLAIESVKDNFHLQLLITWITVLVLVLFIFLLPTTISFSLIALLGVVASFYSTFMLVPSLYSFVFIPKKKKVKQKKVEEVV